LNTNPGTRSLTAPAAANSLKHRVWQLEHSSAQAFLLHAVNIGKGTPFGGILPSSNDLHD
jgi:hypothetical protein